MKLAKLTDIELEEIVDELYDNMKSSIKGYEPIVIPQLLKYLFENEKTQNFNLLSLLIDENYLNVEQQLEYNINIEKFISEQAQLDHKRLFELKNEIHRKYHSKKED